MSMPFRSIFSFSLTPEDGRELTLDVYLVENGASRQLGEQRQWSVPFRQQEADEQPVLYPFTLIMSLYSPE